MLVCAGEPGHGHGRSERADGAAVYDVHVGCGRAALHHVVQGRPGDGGPGAAGRTAAGVGRPGRLRRIPMSGAPGRRRDGAERGHRPAGR